MLVSMNNEWQHFFTSCASRMTSFILYCFTDTIEEEFHYSTQGKFFTNWNDTSNWNFPPRDSLWISSLSLNSLFLFAPFNIFKRFLVPISQQSPLDNIFHTFHFNGNNGFQSWTLLAVENENLDQGDKPQPQHRPNFLFEWNMRIVLCHMRWHKKQRWKHSSREGNTHLVCFDLIRSRCDVLNASNAQVFEAYILEPTTKMKVTCHRQICPCQVVIGRTFNSWALA